MPLADILLGPAFDFAGKIVDKLFPDPAAKAAAQLEVIKLAQSGELARLAADTQLASGQLDVNKVEAASSNIFVSGWRPFIGWICGTGFFVQFVLGPFCTWGSALIGHPVDFPKLDLSEMLPILFGMLGLGALRTTEKVKKVA